MAHDALLSKCTTSSARGLAAVKNDAMSIRKQPLAKRHQLCAASPAALRGRRPTLVTYAWTWAWAARSVTVFRIVLLAVKTGTTRIAKTT